MPGEIHLLDVVSVVNTSKEYAADSPSELIRTLKVKKTALESEKRVREHEADLLVNYAKTLSAEHVSPDQLSDFLHNFVNSGRKNLEAVSALVHSPIHPF